MEEPDVLDPGHPSPGWQFRIGPRTIALVAAGGTVGTAVRHTIGLLIGALGFPLGTFAINVAGAFALGALLGRLDRLPADRATPRRLLLGTGLLGGFTTYSSLSIDTASLATAGAAGTALLYGLGTVLLGLGAAAAGMALTPKRGVR